jgi:hypothetical protein
MSEIEMIDAQTSPCACGRKNINYSVLNIEGEKYGRQVVWCPKCGRAVVGDSLRQGITRWNKLCGGSDEKSDEKMDC